MAKRDPALGPLDVMVSATLAIGDDVEDRLAWAKPQLALYIGGMGARGKNFYHNLATRYGFGEVANHIQDLYLAGRRPRPSTRCPTSWFGTYPGRPTGFVKERVAAYAEAGVTTLLVHPLTGDRRESVRYRRGAQGATGLAATAGLFIPFDRQSARQNLRDDQKGAGVGFCGGELGVEGGSRVDGLGDCTPRLSANFTKSQWLMTA